MCVPVGCFNRNKVWDQDSYSRLVSAEVGTGPAEVSLKLGLILPCQEDNQERDKQEMSNLKGECLV